MLDQLSLNIDVEIARQSKVKYKLLYSRTFYNRFCCKLDCFMSFFTEIFNEVSKCPKCKSHDDVV